ncbi:MAG: 2-amino-4-hydroxy-6-hydroxymethyldihydropteridine diphosphokinase [Caulobacteraceae bacterium]
MTAEELDRVVVVSLGSNLAGAYSTSADLLTDALARFPRIGLHVIARSRWWTTPAWPDPRDPQYLNAVALVDTTMDPRRTLDALLDLERAFGRERGVANAPRTLDLDLIAHGRQVIDAPGLTVPHPRARERAFVMGPLAEIAPDWRWPVGGETAGALARTIAA